MTDNAPIQGKLAMFKTLSNHLSQVRQSGMSAGVVYFTPDTVDIGLPSNDKAESEKKPTSPENKPWRNRFDSSFYTLLGLTDPRPERSSLGIKKTKISAPGNKPWYRGFNKAK